MKHIKRKSIGKLIEILSKLNYVVHTDAVKTYIVPTLTEAQKNLYTQNKGMFFLMLPYLE